MIISATFLKPRERRIREEGRAEERAKTAQAEAQAAQAEAQAARAEAQAATERAAWREWHLLSELAKAKGEEPPPPPFLCTCDCRSD